MAINLFKSLRWASNVFATGSEHRFEGYSARQRGIMIVVGVIFIRPRSCGYEAR
jgi:hypothetical protein